MAGRAAVTVTKPGSAHGAPKFPAGEFRALLRRGNLSGSAAASIAGVNPRTIRRWIGGDSEIPYSAWSLIKTHVDQAELVAEAEKEDWDAPQSAEESFSVLKAICELQHQRCCELEDELAEARRILGETTRRMNQAAMQRQP